MFNTEKKTPKTMYNITLIGTFHSECGLCNSDELYKIIDNINPDVIFLELSTPLFEFCYSEKFEMYCNKNNYSYEEAIKLMPLEMKCIKTYMESHKVDIAPIDIETRDFGENDKFMLSLFSKNERYKSIENEQKDLIIQDGFEFLNSNLYIELAKKKNTIENSIIEQHSCKKELQNTYNMFQTTYCEIRENMMLRSIYDYSKTNSYNQAVFLIGAGHRDAIMRKITEYQEKSEVPQLNWTNYTNKKTAYNKRFGVSRAE